VIFTCELTIPFSTLKTSPATAEIVLSEGMIDTIVMLFPAGCAGLAYVQVWLGGYQLVPWSRGSWIHGDDHLIVHQVKHAVGAAPRLLRVLGYNDDDTNPHTIAISIDVTPFYPTAVSTLPAELLDQLGLT